MPVKYQNFASRFLLISSYGSRTLLGVDFMYSDNNLNQVCKLLKSGEDPNYKIKTKLTPFQTAIAVCEDNVEVIREFINAGADVDAPNGFWGLTPLHIAVKGGKMRVINALINSGASINAKDLEGKTPLHYALISCQSILNPNIIQRLLDCVDIDCNARDSNGDTALMLAVKKKQFGTVVMLLHNRADPNICNEELSTPLHLALERFTEGIENELLLHGACIFTKDKNGYTPLDIIFMHFDIGLRRRTIDLLVKVKIILFRYCLSQDMKLKFMRRLPELSAFIEKCSKEANRMRFDYISSSVTVHDFVSKGMEDLSNQCNIQYQHLILQRLIKDDYPEYFYDILKIIPRPSLFSMLKTNVRSKNYLIVMDLVSDFLSDIDIFRMVLSFSNVKTLTDSMRNLDIREICGMHKSL